MGLDDEKNLLAAGSKKREKLPNEDQLPESDDKESWIKYSLNVHLINNPLRLEGILNLCREELSKNNLPYKRAEWIQSVSAAISTKLADVKKGDFMDSLEEDVKRKSMYNV